MKVKVIELSKIDELLEDYKKFKDKGETFSSFIKVSGCMEDNDIKVFDWNFCEEEDLIEVKEDEEAPDELQELISTKMRKIKKDERRN